MESLDAILSTTNIRRSRASIPVSPGDRFAGKESGKVDSEFYKEYSNVAIKLFSLAYTYECF